MAIGIVTKGSLGNSMFSDQVPSIVYVGEATIADYDHQFFDDIGFAQITSGGDYQFNAGDDELIDTLIGTRERRYIEYDFSTGVGYHRQNTYALTHWQVFSFSKPIVFMEFEDPENYGAETINITDSGAVGGPDNYTRWDLDVLVSYPLGEMPPMAMHNMKLLCFSQIDPDFPRGTGVGVVIQDAAGDTMFHSSADPLRIRGSLEVGVTSGTITVDSTTGFIAGERVSVRGTLNSAIVVSSTSTVLTVNVANGSFSSGDVITGDESLTTATVSSTSLTTSQLSTGVSSSYNTFGATISRPAVVWQDFGREREIVNSQFEHLRRYTSYDFATSTLYAPPIQVTRRLKDPGSAAKTYEGEPYNFMPVIDASEYAPIPATTKIAATGGTEVTSGGFKYHIFKNGGTFTVTTKGTTGMDVFIQGGGAGGGIMFSGGGGAGGSVTGIIGCPETGAYTVGVAATGTAGSGNPAANTAVTPPQGSDSTFLGMVAIGGGGGAHTTQFNGFYGTSYTGYGDPGGCGGGAAFNPQSSSQSTTEGGGTPGQGFKGGEGESSGEFGVNRGGGGGGTSEAGTDAFTSAGDGGDGTILPWLPTSIATAQNIGEVSGGSVYFGGGGGGAGNPAGTPTLAGSGGLGGGGRGADVYFPFSSINNESGTNNTGGGGGGTITFSADSGPRKPSTGGSGVVIIRYTT